MSTIFALATPQGKAGIGVIRISGIYAKKVLQHFKVNCVVKPRVAAFSVLYNSDNEAIDEAVILYFPAPNSFTGEDVIELHIHSSIAVVRIMFNELRKIFRLANPGEFSLRAFLNGKMDLTRAEGIADLINSETDIQLKQALKQVSGDFEKLYANWRNFLIDILASIEAYIDFPDEVTCSALNEIDSKLSELKNSLTNYLNDNHRGERLKNGARIAIIGEPNVGKSTLFNCLAKRDIAIVSEYAGTTRDVLEAHVDIGGYPFIITDTAGIRESDNAIEQEGIKRAKLEADNADLKIRVFPYSGLNAINKDVVKLIDSKTVCVLSKADNIKHQNTVFLFNVNFIPISVHNNIGIDKLLQVIKERSLLMFPTDNSLFITSNRHRVHLQNALDILNNTNINLPVEILSEDLRISIKEIGKVIGAVSSDDILDNIFSKFCLGK
ncbi:tRNA uridine-5-carboxymethylaminomethyl(34) synthesis GTPase MnmE [Neoehrlichia mikurensis]|uniref:tRNA modification GTPase MnmE n=1 Tax=Neoehrlichia mikurensis TaxID=89586 RepID=A0A9Q9C189_9RICK|nr:tRNA uridine-5-carboxymethylaminomethyl(34) synthesis GTPase MnmE [Neoehrlichia mikurensis]QXK92297.1 tRNA uridine-5-carboxymethylaminomethyl(34) synthesis GTPase MnmE [Neoehrlichia mikurensis]QXK92751.1 tRNA uridine-5-carboxymethylaminomethyl(34) synthesis GTPase MnmE [Neoehrlichia mikurensis]QXK93992.1 tRNA uridine-5-carboxymethylaminomethyl(34) synthesis GTPase MnmE [Neoehrlichia mikurensis]UTO55845.1 tRNA uridine-5-carboxymethylaminomethyl(34) synthesis GTPase MnmE [Neoehrlichia mikurens